MYSIGKIGVSSGNGVGCPEIEGVAVTLGDSIGDKKTLKVHPRGRFPLHRIVK
jgi:hypothetical protein